MNHSVMSLIMFLGLATVATWLIWTGRLSGSGLLRLPSSENAPRDVVAEWSNRSKHEDCANADLRAEVDEETDGSSGPGLRSLECQESGEAPPRDDHGEHDHGVPPLRGWSARVQERLGDEGQDKDRQHLRIEGALRGGHLHPRSVGDHDAEVTC